jgi:transcriptional regulator with XRE-family HTH domain
MRPFANVVGEVLRECRRDRALSLHDVAIRSHGLFKPSVLGGYERGERSISVERFCDLANTYGVSADRLLARVLDRLEPDDRQAVVIDLGALAELRDEESAREIRVIAEYVHETIRRREDYLTNVVTLRAGDLKDLSYLLGMSPSSLSKMLNQAMDH